MVNRVRIRFRKQGDLRFASHRDLMRTIERLFRRAGIAVCESEGFHPKPRVHYPASLALGMTGLDEVLEVELVDACEPDQLLALLNGATVPGLEFVAVELLSSQSKKGQPSHLRFEVRLTNQQCNSIRNKAAALLATATYVVSRDSKSVDIRPLIEQLSLADEKLIMQLRVVHEAGARPRDVLEALGLSSDEILELDISRTHVQMVGG